MLYGEIQKLKNEIEETDVIINLAGAPILQRWTKKNKNLIYDSRIKTTQNLVNAIKQLSPEKQPKKFISASAIGIYKAGFIHNESSTDFDSGFVGKVVQDWENVLNDLPEHIQKNTFRIGLVLGKNAKTITKLKLPFMLGLGGKIGNGKQAFPFIHEKDVVRAFVWAAEKPEISGTYNLVAPQQITNADFSNTLAKTVNRPAIFTVPAIALKLVFGEAAVLLLESPVVLPEKLVSSGFAFKYSTIHSALEEIIKK